jgi:histone demethylase JARID1
MQNLSDLNGISRSSKNYYHLLRKFHAQNGTSLNKIPIVDKVPIDLLRLSKIIKAIDSKTLDAKSWKKVAQELGYQTEFLSKWTAKAIQGQYEKWIKPFEEYTNPTNTSTNTLQEKDLQDKDGLEYCKVCLKGCDEDQMLLCDGCNQGWHLYCLEPKMSVVPVTDWFCGNCLKKEDYRNFGFDDGNTRNLQDFEFIANKFKQDWFYKKKKSNPTSTDIEHEFWKLVNSLDDIEVEYGADLHSSHHGSGFPTFERNPKSKYSKCAWNLNNLPIIGKSVFRHIKSDISGMIVPWLYVGMVFSAFCWHTEDHYTYSINYLHWGEQKTWYGIPSFDADKFEKVMKVMMPELFEANPDLLFHLTTMLSPLELIARGVSVFTIDQGPGEFVVTFPRAYHAGFNQGYNFAEAVNFATPDWFGYGRECIERYKEYGKNPVFCHDKLLLSTIHSDLDPENAEWYRIIC